jgi:4-amino-4-deoxy-L-arabinose transferase-like glycosyltransferase
LYSVLGHLAIVAFGEAPWALRLPAALFGIATIPMLYVLGRVVTDRREAAAAALILTVSYHHIWFSQDARGYTALLFCVLLSTYALLRWLDTGQRRFLLLYAFSTAIGAYAHLTTVLVALGQALVCGFGWLAGGPGAHARTARNAAIGFVGAALLTALIYAPMLVDVGAVMNSGATGSDQTTLSWTVTAAMRGLQAGFGTVGAIALGTVLFTAGGWSHFRQRPAVALLFVSPVVVTVVTAVILNRPVRPRFMFFAVGFALLFIVRGAAGAGALVGRSRRTAAARSRGASITVALLTSGAVALSIRSLPYGYRYPKQDYGQAVTFVEQARRDGDLVAVVGDGSAIPIVRYLGRPWTRIDTGGDLRALRDAGAPVWVVSTFPSYLGARHPDLLTILQHDCPEMREIDGTVDDGRITIRRCP